MDLEEKKRNALRKKFNSNFKSKKIEIHLSLIRPTIVILKCQKIFFYSSINPFLFFVISISSEIRSNGLKISFIFCLSRLLI